MTAQDRGPLVDAAAPDDEFDAQLRSVLAPAGKPRSIAGSPAMRGIYAVLALRMTLVVLLLGLAALVVLVTAW